MSGFGSGSRFLDGADVQRLLTDPSVGARAGMAEKLALGFDRAALSPEEQRIAVDILRMMARDVEVQVRQALSANLRANPDVPHDVARLLAADVDDVALPMLESCTVLTDEDLIAILHAGQETKQTAIARRAGLSGSVARVIVSGAAEGAVAALMANETATIPDDAFDIAIDRFPDTSLVTSAMVQRGRLPVAVAERLVSIVSATLREQLMARHELPADMATELLLQARERAMVELAWGANREELIGLVARLHQNGRLTPSIVLRALCTGDEDFFECAMARWAGIAPENAQRLILDRGGVGLTRLVEHCRLPREFLDMSRIALTVSRDLQHDGSPADRRRISRLVIERIVTSLDSAPDTENLDYLIGKLARLEDGTAA